VSTDRRLLGAQEFRERCQRRWTWVVPMNRFLHHDDPIWFGVIKIVTAEVGMITPPIGLNCFIVARYANRPVAEVFHGTFPYFVAHLIAIAILVAFPEIILWLPSHMGN
jgi:TRAP-type C4-dicarboxylate transport system permease large subunit